MIVLWLLSRVLQNNLLLAGGSGYPRRTRGGVVAHQEKKLRDVSSKHRIGH